MASTRCLQILPPVAGNPDIAAAGVLPMAGDPYGMRTRSFRPMATFPVIRATPPNPTSRNPNMIGAGRNANYFNSRWRWFSYNINSRPRITCRSEYNDRKHKRDKCQEAFHDNLLPSPCFNSKISLCKSCVIFVSQLLEPETTLMV